MRNSRPHITGLALGLAVFVWLATRETGSTWRNVPRAVFAGLAVGAVTGHLLRILDDSADSRQKYREAKTRFMHALAETVRTTPTRTGSNGSSLNQPAETLDWLEALPDIDARTPEPEIEEIFEVSAAPTPETTADSPQTVAPIDFRVAFDSAMADGAWAQAFEALTLGRDADPAFVPEMAELDHLRKSAMAEIFRRMHSGTVREDVAALANAVVDTFPDSTEGRTLAQVLGVLRRSAGLCPRCAKPYMGIAAACHDCLRGTPEAYQIAWDEDAGEIGTPG